MLTGSTVKILNKLASESNVLYPEGGLLYRYSFGHCCAHTDLSKIVGASTDNPVEVLELFISSAVSSPCSNFASPQVKQECSVLLNSLASDFEGFQGPQVYIEEDDTSKTISLIYKASNDYHFLELFWSID